MEEESNNEKLASGVGLVCNTSFYHNRCIICQKSDKSYATKKASKGTESEISSLNGTADT